MPLKKLRTFFTFLAGITFLTLSSFTASGNEPFSLDKLISSPDWFTISGNHRQRYESLNEQFRPLRTGSDQILAIRTDIHAAIQLEHFTAGVEFMDSRQQLADNGTPISASIVNTKEFVQQYLALNFSSKQSSYHLKAGRISQNIGSRRFVARNRFRNTLNTFDGISANWSNDRGMQLTGFYFRPVNRLPKQRDLLLENKSENDISYSSNTFSGLHYLNSGLVENHVLELFLFNLNETDNKWLPTADSELFTLGGRFYRKPRVNELDYEVEAAYQHGNSSASRLPTATAALDHRAWFSHLQLGYSFHGNWKPRLLFEFDYASGDKDPNDEQNNRFNTLYGARRFDFGPTSIYGPFARSNIIAAGYRIKLKPMESLQWFIAHKQYRLASNKDAWTTTGLRDPSGHSGSDLGSQIETRLRWSITPENIQLELGAAYLVAGKFMKTVPGNNAHGNAVYAYTQLTLSF